MALTYGRQQSTAPEVMSDEDLYQMTGSWEAAAALRDEQNNALNQYNWSQPASDSGLNLANDVGALPTVTSPTKDDTSYRPVETQTAVFEPPLVDLGDGTFRTPGGAIIDSNGYPATGGLPTTTVTTNADTSNVGNVLSGNILAGASWNSTNNTLADQLTAATGQNTLNTAVGGATTADTLNQLNTFLDSGGS